MRESERVAQCSGIPILRLKVTIFVIACALAGVHGLVPVDTAPIIVNELTLVGSRCGRMEAAIPLIAHELIHVDEMIADRFPLAEAPQAFARAAERGVLKVLLYP